jgi:hypothetical protein
MIGDPDLTISKAWGMLPATANGDASMRTASDNQTVRNVFVIGPDKKIQLILVYPMATGRNFDEVLRDRFAAAHREAQGGHPGELEARRRCDHRRHRPQGLPTGLEGTEAVHSHCAAAAWLRQSIKSWQVFRSSQMMSFARMA